MAAPPTSTKTSLQQRLSARARQRWPQLTVSTFGSALVRLRHRHLADGQTLPLMRLRYGGSAARWGFAIYLASKNGYQDPSCRPDTPQGRPRMHSTPLAASTSVIQRPGPDPRRTYERDH